MKNWTLEDARRLYGIANWGGGYFQINDQGHVVMRSAQHPRNPGVDLHTLAGQLRETGVRLPVLARFEDILDDRIDQLCGAFENAMRECDYNSRHTAVYPIKVNQQRSVVEAILSHGQGRVGLEAGSKPELMAVLGLCTGDSVIVCNGYKDREYLRLALIGRLMGHRTYIVIEKPSELALVIEESRALGVAPLLGMRVRLASIGKGKWQNTGGEKAKFGLSASQALRVIERLGEEQMLSNMQLLHFHMGSQISNIRDIQNGMREAGRFYQALRELGAAIEVVDVGGGLGIDYDGTRSRGLCSMNYSLQEYANNIVRTLKDVCQEQNLPHPQIFTESGRAMTAHHAVLIMNVIDVERLDASPAPQPVGEDEAAILQDLWALYQDQDASASSEIYHDAAHWLSEAQSLYTHGVLNLQQRARAEELYIAICLRLTQALDTRSRAKREIAQELRDKLADKYFCNFSVFQSIPDVWAIQQIFPIMPLHRLDEAPTRRAILQDLTCDSDGHIESYVEDEGIETSLALHEPGSDEPYLLGIFLVGAYQEILGDLHNLFGDTDAINVALEQEHGWRVVDAETGDSVDELLSYVHFDTQSLLAACYAKVRALGLPQAQQRELEQELADGLAGYTYLED